MCKFKIGDVVRVKANLETAFPNSVPKQNGVVREESYNPYVEFKGWGKGHSGNSDNYKSRDFWAVDEEDLVLVRNPSIASDLSLKPQSKTVLRHLNTIGHITPMQALTVYGISRLAATIYDIRKIGYRVDKEMREDASGHRYARYSLVTVQ